MFLTAPLLIHVQSQVSWEEARKSCLCDNAADLASITSAEENAQVAQLTTDNSWIGARDFPVEGSFTWSDGTAWTTYNNWKTNAQGVAVAPNNGGDNANQHCVMMDASGVWDDVCCGDSSACQDTNHKVKTLLLMCIT